jgi:hypothetical protein
MKVETAITYKHIAIGIGIALIAGIVAGVVSPIVSNQINKPNILVLCQGSPTGSGNNIINLTQIDIINKGSGAASYFSMVAYPRGRILGYRFSLEPVEFRVINTSGSIEIESEGQIWPHTDTRITINESGKAGLSYINITTDSSFSAVNSTNTAYSKPFYPNVSGCQ